MTFLRGRRLAMTSSALALMLVAGAQQASAQTLLEVLFGNRSSSPAAHEQYQPGQAPGQQQQQQQQRQRTQPATLPRVSGPSYYDYRTDDLVRIDFAAIALADQVESDDTAAAMPVDALSVGSTRADGPTGEQRRRSPGDETVGVVEQPRQAELQLAARAQPAAAPVAARLTSGDLDTLGQFELRAEKAAAEAVVAHYSSSPDFMWIDESGLTERARQALDMLADAPSHGLNAEDYQVRVPRTSDHDALLRFEMELSTRLLRYARDAQNGRVDPNRISGFHDFEAKPLDSRAVLDALASGDDVAGVLEAYHPQNAYYRSLRAELETLRASSQDQIAVASDVIIRPGNDNPEFANFLKVLAKHGSSEFLAEHGELIERHAGSTTYSQELVPVVRAAQGEAGVGVDGIIGPRTVHAIVGETPAARMDRVKVAMEQIRWLPSDLGDRYVFLNAPAFTASYHEDGAEKLSMRAIYGNTRTQTYFFQDEVSFVEFHPYWGLPRSIVVNTYLPRLLQDPGYFDRSGFEVTTQSGQRVASASVDWGRYGASIPYNVRQTPGPRNALGELKIMFPNKHAIYMHDTPDRQLFDRDNRAISNGCIRLQDPRAMAAAVLGWDRGAVDDRLNGRHSRADLDEKVPVYVAYFTAWPDAAGKVAYHPDVYDRDRRILDAIKKIDDLRSPSA